nr:small acid-soluble spore protein K [Thalassobacillus sp. CUG 92003]
MRNKAKDFPNKKMQSEPLTKTENQALRPNGTINSKPQERMRRSSQDDQERETNG